MAESYSQKRKSLLKSLFVITLFLLAVLPLAYSGTLVGQEYLRLGVITFGLSLYSWWRYDTISSDSKSTHTAILIALGFIFAITQFNSKIYIAPLHTSLWVSSILGIITFGLFLLSHRSLRRLNLLDWTVVGTVIFVLVISVGSHFLFEKSFPWHISNNLVIYILIWFTLTQWGPSEPATGRRLIRTLAVVFGIVCFVGMFRVGKAYYYHSVGERMRNSGDYEGAIAYFEDTAKLSQLLKLESLHDTAIFAKAEILYSQGDVAEAAQTLSLEDGFVLSIPANSWEGPSAGVLYTNISCWKNLTLYEGRVQVSIFARGVPALGVWPQMRVRLDGKVLGEVEVNSAEGKPYIFEVQIESGRQRIEVTFINDYFSPPENRDLWIEQAEIRYSEMAWR